MELTIPTQRNFSFQRTVISHGWCELLPFSLDQAKWELTRVIDLGDEPPVTITIRSGKGHVSATTSRRLNKTEAARVLRDARHILRFDDDLAPFYQATGADPEFAWIGKQGAGRMLRSPTVYEDLVKMICTTNCSWSLTEKMVTGLVQGLGRESDDGRKSFPTPQDMASMPVQFYVDQVRAGYRASYLKELADRVASGELNVETWLTSDLSTPDLVKEMKGVKGVGNYAAENLLKLLGRYDGLALDSWTRAKFFKVRNKGRKANDKKIERYYSRFKEWRGLALWCDVTQDWLD
jgi:3-methyladenine DNA glycosylase/8-oxoguanine DNA glycosylase